MRGPSSRLDGSLSARWRQQLGSFLLGLGIGYVPIVAIVVLGDGEVAGGLSLLLGFAAAGVATYYFGSSLGSADSERRNDKRLRGLLALGIAIGAFPIVFASIAMVCVTGLAMC